jgi:hypothetical protein
MNLVVLTVCKIGRTIKNEEMKITMNSQYHEALAKIETFIEKGFNNLTKKETEDLKDISLAVEMFEKKKYLMPVYTTKKTTSKIKH